MLPSHLHAIAFSIFLLVYRSKPRPNTTHKSWKVSFHCGNAPTCTLRGWLFAASSPVHNYSQPPSNSPNLNLGDSKMMAATQTASMVCVFTFACGAAKSWLSNIIDQIWEKRLQYSACIRYIWCISHCLITAFWCNTIKPRQTLKKTDIILLQVKQIIDSVESLVLSKFLWFHRIHLIKEMGRLAFTVSVAHCQSSLAK